MAKFKLGDKVILHDNVKTVLGIAKVSDGTIYYLIESIDGFPYSPAELISWTEDGYEIDEYNLIVGNHYYWTFEDEFKGYAGPQPSWRENTLTFKFI